MKVTFRLLSFSLIIFFCLPRDSLGQEIAFLRTPEARFETLPDYPFKAHYLTLNNGLRMHYVDEGRRNAPVILLLHGEPSWSYIYRLMIPKLESNGYRVIAPDLVGFGKSDKPTDSKLHSYINHSVWLTQFIKSLKLSNIHLYAHDWGGMLALRVIAEHPDHFATVAISNAFLFTGDRPFPDSFLGWQNYSQTDKIFDPGVITNWGTNTELPSAVVAAYSAPFPDESYKTAIRRFPVMIPSTPEDPEAMINKNLREKLKHFKKPFLTLWSNHKDDMWEDKDTILQKEIPGARGLYHERLEGGHFIQEDQHDKIVTHLLDLINTYQKKGTNQ